MSALKILILLLFVLVGLPVSAQQFLDEMEAVDISDDEDVKSTIIRNPEEALLVVKSQITQLKFRSNNLIKRTEKGDPGTWYIHLAPGTHRINIQAPGFMSIQKRLFFIAKEVKGIKINIVEASDVENVQNSGILVCKSDPSGAEVFLNDELYGNTTFTGRVESGAYRLKIVKDDYRIYESDITIVPGDIIPLNIKLEPFLGGVIVNSIPSGAAVTLDGREVGKTPYRSEDVQRGRHSLSIKLEDYEDFNTDFELTEDNTVHTVSQRLSLKSARVSVVGSPSRATIIVDGRRIGSMPLNDYAMTFGNHTLEFSKSGFHSQIRRLAIDNSNPYRLSVNLEPKSKFAAGMYSFFIPGAGQLYSGRTTPGIYILAATVIGSASGYFFYTEYSSAKDDYESFKNAYEENVDVTTMSELYQDMQDGYSNMETMYYTTGVIAGATALIWLYNIVDTFVFFPDQSAVSLTSSFEKDAAMMTMTYHF